MTGLATDRCQADVPHEQPHTLQTTREALFRRAATRAYIVIDCIMRLFPGTGRRETKAAASSRLVGDGHGLADRAPTLSIVMPWSHRV